ncbi:MAG: cystathionine gamma-synthase [Bdellovibrio sp.]|nr:MAG: cystathionine gamma-synthase [Bdellovibrio sp.]
MLSENYHFETLAIHAGQEPDPSFGAIMTPITLATTFVQPSPGEFKEYDYSRAGNPTRTAFEKCIATLEKGKYGFAFSSGCAASTIVMHLLKSGDHVIACDDMYGGSFRLFDKVIKNNGIEFSYVDLTNAENLESAIQPNTRLIWVETPSNPTLKISPIKKITEIASKKNILTAVDNTFMSPYFQNPLSLGADIVIHSATKYISGHSDVLAGVVVTNIDALAEKIKFLSKSMGPVLSPFDSYLALRSLKTLALRMEAHQKNALAIAKWLEDHPKVEKVLYPGLESHPQHTLAKEQMKGYGGMISFYLKGGLKESKSFLEGVQIFSLAESLGGVESLIEHPAIMTHSSVPKEVRQQLGIEDNLIRLSVGVENVNDLIADLEQAFHF